MRPALRRLPVTAIAVAGLGLLGSSVQGVAAVDTDLAAATKQHRHAAPQHRDGRDCPKPHRKQQSVAPDFRS
ncbi:hypothetical protein [Conexibacter sp. SYSU D00693]|uniref:hypothetical protein n=1 Tax=Conexibacter sp. SYSU D00693 TaxID=2812560 RepID=UPI00196BA823|nr:hypothetical protein [Conexibacter sp. SYSU D00693]